MKDFKYAYWRESGLFAEARTLKGTPEDCVTHLEKMLEAESHIDYDSTWASAREYGTLKLLKPFDRLAIKLNERFGLFPDHDAVLVYAAANNYIKKESQKRDNTYNTPCLERTLNHDFK